MPDIWMDVDTAVVVPVNLLQLLDDADFKTIETAIVYNSTGLVVTWNFVTSAGVVTGTAITPTTAGVYDWSEPIADKGMYAIEIPASGGVSANNDTEGYGWITGVATGVLPFRGPTIGFRRAAINDLLVDGSTASTNLEDFFDGTGYAGGTAKLTVDTVKWLGTACATPTTAGVPEVDTTHVSGTIQTAGDLAALVTTVDTVVDAILVDTTEIGVAGAGLTNINLPNQTMDITGNLSGSVGSVTGAVGSVTGNVGGNVIGSVGSLVANAIDNSSLHSNACAKITDSGIQRGASFWENNSDPRSLGWAISKLVNKVDINGAGDTLSIRKSDDSTALFTQAITTSGGAAPVVGLDTA